jgi:hypothetical protein
MLRITAIDGAVFIGPDYRQIADAMHQDEWHPSKQLEDWMARVADRVGQITGEQVRCGEPEGFLLDLQRLGFVTIDNQVA